MNRVLLFVYKFNCFVFYSLFIYMYFTYIPYDNFQICPATVSLFWTLMDRTKCPRRWPLPGTWPENIVSITYTFLYIYIYIYIYIVIKRQTVSLCNNSLVARHARFSKLGSKPGRLERQSKRLPHNYEETIVSKGILNAYVSHLFCLHISA